MKREIIKTASIAATQFCMGLVYGGVGPTLPAISENTAADQQQLSVVFTARGFGYLFGSVLSGMVGVRMNSYLYLFATMLLTSCCLYLVPFVSQIALVVLIFSVEGFHQGSADTLGNILLIRMWKKKCGPIIQTTKFSFALGASISPMIASPFISSAQVQAASCGSVEPFQNTTNTTTLASFNENDNLSSDVKWVYLIYAGVATLSTAYFFAISCSDNFKSEPESKADDKKETTKEDYDSENLKPYKLVIAKTLLFSFFFLYVGAEASLIGFLYRFATGCRLAMSPNQAVVLSTVFLASFALGRFSAIFVAMITKPSKQIMINLIGVIVSVCFILISYLFPEKAAFALFVGVGVFGLSIATLFGSCFAWAESKIKVTNKTAITMVVGASSGEMVVPIIVGLDVEKFLVPFCVTFAVLETTVFCLLKLIVKKPDRNLKVEENKGNNVEMLLTN